MIVSTNLCFGLLGEATGGQQSWNSVSVAVSVARFYISFKTITV